MILLAPLALTYSYMYRSISFRLMCTISLRFIYFWTILCTVGMSTRTFSDSFSTYIAFVVICDWYFWLVGCYATILLNWLTNRFSLAFLRFCKGSSMPNRFPKTDCKSSFLNSLSCSLCCSYNSIRFASTSLLSLL